MTVVADEAMVSMVSYVGGDGDDGGGDGVTSISGRGCCMASLTLGRDCASVFSSFFCSDSGLSGDKVSH